LFEKGEGEKEGKEIKWRGEFVQSTLHTSMELS
jgi:hypothetical protein